MPPKGYRYFHIVSMLFVTSLLVANTVSVKIITFAGFQIPAGILCFPIAYIINDVLTEVYGYKKAKMVIWWGFIALTFMSIIYYLSTIIKPATFWKGQTAFEKVFTIVPRVALGSLIAFLLGSLLNSCILSQMKVWMDGEKLWMRTIGSTILGEGLDSIIFNMIAFMGIVPFWDLMTLVWSGFLLKTLYEIVATPLTCIVVEFLKKKEDENKYDVEISYSLLPGK
jgi:uncharacterized integral membrane protein (TIGR00697 family)